MDLFFEREKTRNGEWPNTLSIDIFPSQVREQCWQAWKNSYDTWENSSYQDNLYKIVKFLRERLGKQHLTAEKKEIFNGMVGGYVDNYREELREFFLKGFGGGETSEDIKYAFTVLEIICISRPKIIDKVNAYLKRGGIGYNFTNGRLVPFSDENLLETSIKPVISLLNQPRFKHTYEYYLNAFKNYREGDYQGAIDNCVKAFECLLKTIFAERGIEYAEECTLNPLIQKAYESSLFLDISQDKVTAIPNLLKILGDVRNKRAGHGGKDKTNDPKLVRFSITQATCSMLYMAEIHLEGQGRSL
jgi:hypothetical protein